MTERPHVLTAGGRQRMHREVCSQVGNVSTSALTDLNIDIQSNLFIMWCRRYGTDKIKESGQKPLSGSNIKKIL